MAQTIGDLLKEIYPPSVIGQFTGSYIRIPIMVDHAKRDWKAAVDWLEAREAVRVEWPWPER